MDQQEQIYELEIDLLQPNPLQPRGLIAPESLVELADSIRSHGVLEPQDFKLSQAREDGEQPR
jgi:ParB-like chromosome segregation protein Spo0J